MKNKNEKRAKSFHPNGNRKGKKSRISDDSFFSQNSKRRLRKEELGVIESSDSGEDDLLFGSGRRAEDDGTVSEDSDSETADEKRLRMAKALVEMKKAAAKRMQEDEDEEDEEDENGHDGRSDKCNLLAAKLLETEQLELSGRARREIAQSVHKPENGVEFKLLLKHRMSVTSVALADDDSKGFSASKDGGIVHWDVESRKNQRYKWPSDDVLKSHGLTGVQGKATKQSKHVLAMAVSSDDRYLASGGFDRHVHLWDIRTQQHVSAFPGHRAPVSCLAFRKGTPELFSGSFDRSIKLWNAEDKTYMDTLFGHDSEVLTIDCLRNERVLTTGRDRTMQLWKVPEASRVIFRSPAPSMECCCFVSNDEFLSGSDDGSIALWSMLRKKPNFIVQNAHRSLELQKKVASSGQNGYTENGFQAQVADYDLAVSSWISSICVCPGSDLAASGAGDGAVRLWSLKSGAKDIKPLFDLKLSGFVNSLVFAKSGRFIVAGVGKEPRLGRWASCPIASNGVMIHPLKLS